VHTVKHNMLIHSIIWFLLTLFVLVSRASAVETHLPLSETSVIVKVEYYPDQSAVKNINEVASRTSNIEWVLLEENHANFGYQPMPYWYRFTLANPSSDSIKQILEIAYPLLDTVDLYEFNENKLFAKYHTGDRVPYSQRPVEHPHFLFPIELNSGEKHTFYLKVMTNGSQLVPLTLWKSTELFLELGKEDALHAIYFGVVMVVVFFNLLIFIALREKMYLYYAISAFLFLMFFAIMRAKLYPYIFSSSPAFHHLLLLLLPSSCLIFSTLFSREFMSIKKFSPQAYMLTNVILLIGVAGISGVFLLDSQTSLKLSVASVVLASFTLLILGPIIGLLGNKMAWVYSAAWGVLMLGAAITALSKQGLVPVGFLTEYGMQIGSALELFILNGALAYRFYREHQGRIAAQQAQLVEYEERRDIEKKLLDNSMSDSVTLMPNRYCFEQQINKEIELRHGERIAVVIIEILRYPEISRTLGHHNTDLMMVELADHYNHVLALLPGHIKIQRPSCSENVCSLGNGSFGLLLNVDFAEQRPEEVNTVISKVIEALEFKEMRLELKPSIGVAVCPEHGLNPSTLLRHAQVAADSSEAFHRNMSYYKPEHDQYNTRRLMLVSELKDAIQNNDLELYFQPKFNLKKQMVCGVEALVRWHHKRYGMIRPDEFISIAEQTGIIKALTRWVVKESFIATNKIKEQGYDIQMSINLSAMNLGEDDLIRFLKEQLSCYQVVANNIFFELTETSMMSKPTDAIDVLNEIRDLGFQVSVDDFGAGYSSLAYLSSLPANEIKIDMSIISGICSNESNDLIVDATIKMCHQLGFVVVAEGVENREIMDRLDALNCDTIQGYLLTPPLPIGELFSWLGNNEATQQSAS